MKVLNRVRVVLVDVAAAEHGKPRSADPDILEVVDLFESLG